MSQPASAASHRFSLEGKHALVTGASSGLGWRFAETLADAGADVALAARRLPLLEELAGKIRRRGGRALAVPVDVTQSGQVEKALEVAEAALGTVTIVVNSAGVLVQQWLGRFSEADFDRLMDTNLKGTWLVSQAAARRMIGAGRGGSIINIASIAGLITMGRLGIYGVSKAAVIQLTRSMALEWARDQINVNAICPGYIETPINAEHWRTEWGRATIERLPRRRIGTPADLDGLLLLLASDASRFLTGAVIPIDDGQSLVL